MEFIVNEQGCRNLSTDLLGDMKRLAIVLSNYCSEDGNLKAALGDDYAAFNKTITTLKSELESAQKELDIIISSMNEYMSIIHEARVTIEG